MCPALQDYPLFTTVNRILHGQIDPTYVTQYVEGATKHIPAPGEVSEQPTDPGTKKVRYAPLTLTL